jgi:hypothetical protein
MPALFRVGEAVGPGTVVSDEFSVLEDGRFVEHVVTSWGQQMHMHGRELESYDRFLRFTPDQGDHVIYPHTVVHESTLEGAPADAEWINVSESPIAYWSALCDYWQPWNLTVVEHDVQARPNIFAEFDECEKPWCYFHYSNFTEEDIEAWRWGILGCTRFRKELIEAAPSAVTDIEPRHRDWHYMSTGLGQNLRAAGFKPHIHSVVNHHRMMDLREAGLFA